MIKTKTKQRTILVIEDERPLIKVIQAKLEKKGFDVVTARTIDQGMDCMKEINIIDAIWLDHYLPGEKTGLDFVAKIKSPKSKWAHIPIFIVSNTASDSNVRSYMRLGVSKYCVKAKNRLEEIVNDMQEFLDKKEE